MDNSIFDVSEAMELARLEEERRTAVNHIHRVKRAAENKPHFYAVGIVGLGKLGRAIAESLLQYTPDISKVFLYDLNIRESEDVKKNLASGLSSERRHSKFSCEVCDNLEMLVKDSDLVLLTAGRQFKEPESGSDEERTVMEILEGVEGLRFRKEGGGKGLDYRIKDLAVNLSLIKELAAAFDGKSRGKHVILYTNPPDILCYVFALASGFDRNLSGYSHIDTFRARNVVLPEIFREIGINNVRSDISCIGDHGGGSIPVVPLSHINGIDIQAFRDCNPEFVDLISDYTADYPTKLARGMGLDKKEATKEDKRKQEERVRELLRAENPFVMREVFNALFSERDVIEASVFGRFTDFVPEPSAELSRTESYRTLVAEDRGLFIGFGGTFDFPFFKAKGMELDDWTQLRFFDRYLILSKILDGLRDAGFIKGYVEPHGEEQYRATPKTEAEQKIITEILLKDMPGGEVRTGQLADLPEAVTSLEGRVAELENNMAEIKKKTAHIPELRVGLFAKSGEAQDTERILLYRDLTISAVPDFFPENRVYLMRVDPPYLLTLSKDRKKARKAISTYNLKVWDLDSTKSRAIYNSKFPIADAAISDENIYAAIDKDGPGQVLVFRCPELGEPVNVLEAIGGIGSVAVSRKGVYAGSQGSILYWSSPLAKRNKKAEQLYDGLGGLLRNLKVMDNLSLLFASSRDENRVYVLGCESGDKPAVFESCNGVYDIVMENGNIRLALLGLDGISINLLSYGGRAGLLSKKPVSSARYGLDKQIGSLTLLLDHLVVTTYDSLYSANTQQQRELRLVRLEPFNFIDLRPVVL